MKNGDQSAVGQASRTPVGQASRLSDIKWRRHLPHYQLSSGYFFIAFATHNRVLLRPLEKDCVFNTVCYLYSKKYELYAVVVLNDHVHMVVNPIETLPKIMHSIKSFTLLECSVYKHVDGIQNSISLFHTGYNAPYEI